MTKQSDIPKQGSENNHLYIYMMPYPNMITLGFSFGEGIFRLHIPFLTITITNFEIKNE
jgi:hypothetical protein